MKVTSDTSFRDRIIASTQRTSLGCWEWTKGRYSNGYGILQARTHPSGRHNHLAHRIAYEEFVGSIPVGMTVDHLCRNRACCNPAHMELVSLKENILRGTSVSAINAKKKVCPRHSLPYDRLRKNGSRTCSLCISERNHRAYLKRLSKKERKAG